VLQDAPKSSPALGFNLSHDRNTILLAVRTHEDILIARDIGLDVMHVGLPQGGLFAEFLESIGSMVCSSKISLMESSTDGISALSLPLTNSLIFIPSLITRRVGRILPPLPPLPPPSSNSGPSRNHTSKRLE
jgi:hypothetical protein